MGLRQAAGGLRRTQRRRRQQIRRRTRRVAVGLVHVPRVRRQARQRLRRHRLAGLRNDRPLTGAVGPRVRLVIPRLRPAQQIQRRRRPVHPRHRHRQRLERRLCDPRRACRVAERPVHVRRPRHQTRQRLRRRSPLRLARRCLAHRRCLPHPPRTRIMRQRQQRRTLRQRGRKQRGALRCEDLHLAGAAHLGVPAVALTGRVGDAPITGQRDFGLGARGGLLPRPVVVGAGPDGGHDDEVGG